MKKNACLIYFLSHSLFLGFGISLLFYQSKKDCYFGALLGTLIGLIIMYFYNYIINHKEKTSLKYLYQKDKIMGNIAKTLMLIFSLIILAYTIILYTTFVISFLLVNSSVFYVLIPYLLLAIYLAFKDLKVISRVAFILLPISIIIVTATIIGLGSFFEASNFLPILTTTPLNFFKTALIYTGISTFPNILTLHFNKDTKGNMAIYTLASVFIILIILCINGVLGEALTNIFRFPEYMVLKQFQIFRFIEKVENIVSAIWVLDLFFTTTMAIYSIKETITSPKNKIITVLIVIILSLILNKYFIINYINELRLYYILPFISLIGSIIIIIPFLYLIKKKN